MTELTEYSWPFVLGELTEHRALEGAAAGWAMNQIVDGLASPAQIAAFGVAMRLKVPTAVEIDALAGVMLDRTTPVPTDRAAVDIVGTGGDRSNSVNISSMAAVVTAAAGGRVIKHGARAASSKSGGADMYEALGVVIDLDAEGVAATVAELGIGFCFAPAFHPSMRFAAPARRELGIPTVFNVLGPLANPARPVAGVVGCAFLEVAPALAETFARRGQRETVMVVRGDDGLDELTTTSTSTVWRVDADGAVRTETVDAAALGFARVDRAALLGGDAAHNAEVARAVFAGASGATRDAVLLNAAAALAVLPGIADGVRVQDAIAAQLDRVRDAIDSGAAARLLDAWVTLSGALSGTSHAGKPHSG